MNGSPTEIDRRSLLKKGSVLAGAGVVSAGAAGLAAPAAAAAGKRKATYDVACLGDTFRLILHPDANPQAGELRGSTFSVEGSIYRAGTIRGTGFDPASAQPLGRWFCRGWFLINPERPEPHVITTQEYVFGQIRPNRLFPRDTLVSSGLEGTFEEQTPIRSVIGGTGEYAGATGVVLQHGRATNTTRIVPLGIQAPNFRFEFQLRLPEL
jgi:hypothetical protein